MYVAMSRISKLENMHQCTLIQWMLTITIIISKGKQWHTNNSIANKEVSKETFWGHIKWCRFNAKWYFMFNRNTALLKWRYIRYNNKFQNNFSMYYNSSTDKHRSITFGYSSNIYLCESSIFCSMSLVNVKKSTFLDKPVKVALRYRPPNSPSLFLQNMKSWIDEKTQIFCLVISV